MPVTWLNTLILHRILARRATAATFQSGQPSVTWPPPFCVWAGLMKPDAVKQFARLAMRRPRARTQNELSLTLITGLTRDLASAEGPAAKGSQRSLNQAWLTIRPDSEPYLAHRGLRERLADAPDIYEETARRLTSGV